MVLKPWPKIRYHGTTLFCVRRSRGEMYVGHARLCVCLSVPRRRPTLLHGLGCNLGNGRGCPLIVHYRADLHSVHVFRCYDNIARTRNVSECLHALYAWLGLKSAARRKCEIVGLLSILKQSLSWVLTYEFIACCIHNTQYRNRQQVSGLKLFPYLSDFSQKVTYFSEFCDEKKNAF